MESNFSDRGFWVREAFGEAASMDLWTAARAKTETEAGEPPYTTCAQLLHEVLHHPDAGHLLLRAVNIAVASRTPHRRVVVVAPHKADRDHVQYALAEDIGTPSGSAAPEEQQEDEKETPDRDATKVVVLLPAFGARERTVRAPRVAEAVAAAQEKLRQEMQSILEAEDILNGDLDAIEERVEGGGTPLTTEQMMEDLKMVAP